MRKTHKAKAAAAVVAAVLATGCASASSTAASHPPASTAVPTAAQTHAVQSPSAEVIAAAMGVTTMPGYVAYTASTDPNHLLGRQGGYTSKVDWGTAAEGTNSIEVYPDASGVQKRYLYMKALQGTIVGDGYDYLVGTALLRLSTYWTPTQASALAAKFAKAAT